jgi:hypothetical protein
MRHSSHLPPQCESIYQCMYGEREWETGFIVNGNALARQRYIKYSAMTGVVFDATPNCLCRNGVMKRILAARPGLPPR